MLERYIRWDGFKSIPLTNDRYQISFSGDIYNSITGTISKCIINDIVEVNDWTETKLYKRSVLLALVAKQCRIPFTHWHLLDTIPIDGNENNISPDNLIWKFPKDGLRVNSSTDFSFIPGFSRYSINKDGVVFSHATGKILSPYQDKLGYWMYGCQPDVGKRTIYSRHRLLALAFLEYPPNVSSLDVNHIDGIKENYCLENLEWCSRKHNCDHAYSTGLRKDNIIVSVRNSFTGEIKDYYSISECARQLSVSEACVWLRIRNQKQSIYPPGYQFKRKDDLSEWQVYENPEIELKRNGFSKEISSENVTTGEKNFFKSSSECALFLKIKPSAVQARLREAHGRPVKNIILRYTSPLNQMNSLIDLK